MKRFNDMDDFEQRLKRQPLRAVPAGWREEILSAARDRAARGEIRNPSPPRSRRDWFLELLWPSPAAWAGVAALWLVILVVRLGTPHVPEHDTIAHIEPLLPAEALVLKEQWRLRAELAGSVPAPAPQPRSEAPRNESQALRRAVTEVFV